MGRPPLIPGKRADYMKIMTINMPKSHIELLDRLALKLGMHRSELMRLLIRYSIVELIKQEQQINNLLGVEGPLTWHETEYDYVEIDGKRWKLPPMPLTMKEG